MIFMASLSWTLACPSLALAGFTQLHPECIWTIRGLKPSIVLHGPGVADLAFVGYTVILAGA